MLLMMMGMHSAHQEEDGKTTVEKH